MPKTLPQLFMDFPLPCPSQNPDVELAGIVIDSRAVKPGYLFVAMKGGTADGHDYIVSYNDCCGKSSCGRCLCNRNERDRPLYMAGRSNDYNWCVGSRANLPYHCTVSRIVRVVTE